MPPNRTGLLIIRAWTENGSAQPLRAQIRSTTDVAAGIQHSSVQTDIATVGVEVQTWLRDILADAQPAT